jgi:two-component system, sensor histidine kinase and response regulator
MEHETIGNHDPAHRNFSSGWHRFHDKNRSVKHPDPCDTSQLPTEALLKARLELMDAAPNLSLPELLVMSLDIFEPLVQSRIGFFHFVEPDQENLCLQAWSTKTAAMYCKAAGHGSHYGISKAGIWADAIRQRCAIIHNDYQNFDAKRGMPEGHAKLDRQLVVPVFRDGLIVALLGVGNKPEPYDQQDLEIATKFADLAWDAVERKRSEIAVRSREERYARLFGNDALFVYPLNEGEMGCFEEANTMATRMLGFSRDEFLAMLPEVLTAPEEHAKRPSQLARLQATGSDVFESTVVTRSGVRIPVEISERLFEDSGRSLVLTTVRDISERKKVQEESYARQAAEAASRAKSEFLAGMSHEIRTPMNGIIGMSELALRSGIEGEPRRMLEIVHRSALDLMGILNDILDLSKVEKGKLELHAEPFSPRTLLEDIRNLMEGQCLQKGIALVLECAQDLPETMLGDGGRLRQILLNLVGNAVKFTHTGSVRLSASILSTSLPPVVRFEVSDTGAGIAPETLRWIFEPFRQEDSSIAKRFGGTGLGLSISRQLVRLMGGEIEVESRKGHGSRFAFELPLDQGSTHPESAQPARSSMPVNLSGRVLVVDDNEVNRMVCQGMLDFLGVECVCAESAAMALNLLVSERFDLVLMDVQMPEMDGLEATRCIRHPRDPILDPNIPIIALTAGILNNEIQRCMEAGMNGHLSKPLLPEALEEILSKHLRQN